MVDSNSPLRYLDYDVTKYLYETYFPTPTTKLNYNKVVEEFKYLKKKYDVIDHYVLDIIGIKYCLLYICIITITNHFLSKKLGLL